MQQIKPVNVGLITGLTMVCALLFSFYVLKNPVESNFQFAVYILFSLGIVFSLFIFSKKKEGMHAGFKDYFSTGFKTFVVVVFIMAVFTFIFFSFNTSFRDNKIAENTKLIIAQGNHLPNEIAGNEKKLRQMFLPIMVSSAVFRYLIIGAIVTAVAGGFFSQQKKPG